MELLHLYIASCTPSGGICHYTFRDGTLTLQEKTPVDRPMYLTVHQNRLYAVLLKPFSDRETSGVQSWEIGPEGTLRNPSALLDTQGRCGCHLSRIWDSVYVANYVSGELTRLPQGQLVTHTGHGPSSPRQDAAHPHFVGMTPDAKYLLAIDLGLDKVFLYTPELELHGQFSVPAGAGCRHGVFSPDGKYLFCANELASSITSFRYEDGRLYPLGTVSALPADYTGESYAAAIRCDHRYVYISNRGHDSVTVFTHENGRLVWNEQFHTEGVYPTDFDLYRDYLFCANQKSDEVCLFRKKDGNWVSQHTVLSIPRPSCIAIVPQK